MALLHLQLYSSCWAVSSTYVGEQNCNVDWSAHIVGIHLPVFILQLSQFVIYIQYLYALIPGRSMPLLVASWCCLGVIVPVQLASSWIRGCFFLSERCKRIGYSKGWLPCWLYSTFTLYVLSVGFQLVETTSTMQWCNLATTEHVKCFIGG